MAEALAAYLMGINFWVHGGDDPHDYELKLRQALERWPRPEEVLLYPSVSIVDTTGTERRAHNFTPTPLEETAGAWDHLVRVPIDGEPPRTVLWKENEARAPFQVDFWTDNDADRQAIDARLDDIFSPEEGRTGVLIEASELYYSISIRFTLMGSPKYDDTGISAHTNERRLRCTIIGECDTVSLREAQWMTTRVVDTVEDPNDPLPDEEGFEL
jgi:hypothetical protein